MSCTSDACGSHNEPQCSRLTANLCLNSLGTFSNWRGAPDAMAVLFSRSVMTKA